MTTQCGSFGGPETGGTKGDVLQRFLEGKRRLTFFCCMWDPCFWWGEGIFVVRTGQSLF